MDEYKPKRYLAVFSDDDQIKDYVLDTQGNEHVVTLSGKQWKDYDWILGRYEEIARRLIDQCVFLVERNKDCTVSWLFGATVEFFVKEYHATKDDPPHILDDIKGRA